MRQFLFAASIMLVGVLGSTALAFGLANTWRSFNDHWLIPLVFLPAIGVAMGCWLAHKASQGQDPWPITDSGGRVLFVLLGAVGSVAASYLVYIAISSVWFNADFIEMVLSPSLIKNFTETNKFGQHESSPISNAVIGLLAGSYGTFRLIKEKPFV